MFDPASSAQTALDLPITDRQELRARAAARWRAAGAAATMLTSPAGFTAFELPAAWSRGSRVSPRRSLSWFVATRSLGCLAALVVAVVAFALVPARASAEPLCTDTWTGSSEGHWTVAGNWSKGKVPSSTDVACIGTGTTVEVNEGANQVEALEDKGTLVLFGGALELAGTLEASTTASLTLGGGTLLGPGSLHITGSLEWHGGTMAGSGSTVLESGSTATIGVGADVLSERSLVNHGTVTMSSGLFNLELGASITNAGTFKANSEWGAELFRAGEHGTGSIVNSGTFEKTEGEGKGTVSLSFENKGTVAADSGVLSFTAGASSSSSSEWHAAEGKKLIFEGGSVTWTGGKLTGPITIKNTSVTTTEPPTAGQLELESGSLTMSGTMMVERFILDGNASTGTLLGTGALHVSKSFEWRGGTMSGSGSTVLESGSTSTIAPGFDYLNERLLVNHGTVTMSSGLISLEQNAMITNTGIFKANSEWGAAVIRPGELGTGTFVNTGTFEKTEGEGNGRVQVFFENAGIVETLKGHLIFEDAAIAEPSTQWGGSNNKAPGQIKSSCGDPVSCATGDYSETQTDFAVGGRGVGLDLTRTYNSQAGAAGVKGIFGYGWSSSFSDHIELVRLEEVGKSSEWAELRLYAANGSTATFIDHVHGVIEGPAGTQDRLRSTESVYTSPLTLTLPDQTEEKFSSGAHRLESVTDRDGNVTTLSYNESGRLTTITDPASRTIKLTYNGEGLVESAEDPMKHVVKYTYESGNLKSVTQPAEAGLRWQFKYDSEHQMTEMLDGREGKTVNEYNGSHQVTKQKDPAGHTLKFAYEPFYTKITNETTGSVTNEFFTSDDEPSSITRGSGTLSATTESFTYNAGGYVTSITDGDGHVTTYGYDSTGDRTSMVDPDKDETKWTYDSTHDVETTTTPDDETTTIKREAHGNPEVIERPAPESKTQTTKYKYFTHGELESVTNPLEHTSKYEYDSKGDRTAETDPEGNKRTWEYNEDSQETATVSPRGNISGGKPTEFTTKLELDAQGRVLTVTDPLKHTTKYKYDGDGNVEKLTDGNSHTTTYTYSADNQPTKVEAPNKAITEIEYDGAGQVIKQTDGNKHVTEYKRNAVEEVTEVVDPLKHKTTKEYDAAGNLVKVTDPKGRTTTYTYDPANRLTEISYSSGTPSAIKYEYNKDGDRTKMTDATGTTTYTYDQLDRQTETENGHKESFKYEYDLADNQTKITYPITKAVNRTFDKDGRLEKITDWNSKETKFVYNEDSELKTTTFPGEAKDEDKDTYNDADQLTEAKMLKSTETLASLIYTRDSDGQVKKTTAKSLPGSEVTEAAYDENNRVTKYGSTEYKYDAANNLTKEGSSTNTYNEGDELEKGTGVTYAYDELGERTKATPEKGGASAYGYDQAGNLISVERPEKESIPKIEDAYAYNGEGLRTSQTISGTTSYLAWNLTEGLPLILSDSTNSYIYGPGGLPVEQINNSTGTVLYLHHDQSGSTRLLTGSTGKTEATFTYGPYGELTGSTGTATTPLGYDGQYTSSDTGLIYLRNRVYDPKTAQFLTVDPLVSISGAPYNYAGDNPLTYGDSLGLLWTPLAGGAGGADAACGATFEIPGVDVGTCGAAGIATGAAVIGAGISLITGEEAGNDEGEAELKAKEAERENCGNPASSPGSKFEWKGKGEPGSEEGSWFDPETDEYLRPDFKPSSHGPHYDYRGEDGTEYRIYPDGRIEPKQP
jgi:RHS repeat-associated protein